jgi:hypothetical protein
MKRHLPLVFLLSSSLGLSACDPITLTVLGIGASTGVSYGMNSVAYKTFTAPMKRVNKATVRALGRMGIKVKGIEKFPDKQIITAESNEHELEITLEAVSTKTTRIRSIARNGAIFLDRATANEVIVQTEKVLAGT